MTRRFALLATPIVAGSAPLFSCDSPLQPAIFSCTGAPSQRFAFAP